MEADKLIKETIEKAGEFIWKEIHEKAERGDYFDIAEYYIKRLDEELKKLKGGKS